MPTLLESIISAQSSSSKSSTQGLNDDTRDVILADTNKFEVSREIKKSVINIYNPKTVILGSDDVDKTTRSERREEDLERRRKGIVGSLGGGAVGGAVGLGGANNPTTSPDGDPDGSTDSFLPGIIKRNPITSALGALAVGKGALAVGRGSGILARILSPFRAFLPMGVGLKPYIDGTKSFTQLMAATGKSLTSFVSRLPNMVREAKLARELSLGVGRISTQTTGSLGANAFRSINPIQRMMNQVRGVGAATSQFGTSFANSARTMNVARNVKTGSRALMRGTARMLFKSPWGLPFLVASEGLFYGLDAADETNRHSQDTMNALGYKEGSPEFKMKQRNNLMELFNGMSGNQYHKQMADFYENEASGVFEEVNKGRVSGGESAITEQEFIGGMMTSTFENPVSGMRKISASSFSELAGKHRELIGQEHVGGGDSLIPAKEYRIGSLTSDLVDLPEEMVNPSMDMGPVTSTPSMSRTMSNSEFESYEMQPGDRATTNRESPGQVTIINQQSPQTNQEASLPTRELETRPSSTEELRRSSYDQQPAGSIPGRSGRNAS